MLKGSEEGFINLHRLVVTLVTVLHLLHKLFTLHKGIVQLRVCIAELLLVHKQLKSLRQTQVRAVPLGQRAHDTRVVANERWVRALRLQVVSDEGIKETRRGERGVALHLVLLAQLQKPLACLLRVEVSRELDVQSLLQFRNDVQALEGLVEVEGDGCGLLTFRVFGSVRDNGGSVEINSEAVQQILCHRHDVVVVLVCPVGLDRRELGVVREINAFVTELTTQLVDAVHTSDYKFLQIQLGCDTQEHALIQVVVVCDKGASSGTSSDHVQHGCLHLSEVKIIKELADV
mmetsp:Transcript_67809/g.78809  ORF Transcript_67809/g.78809 Transcript_67809/m.78809 type:complete len:289 (-) Transcript_67809:322-1188(-)